MKPENDGNTQIRLKYEYEYTKYTRKDKKYTNTNLTICTLSQIRGGENAIFQKKFSHEKGGN